MTTSEKFVPQAPTIAGPNPDTRRPRVKFPAGACDCHAHVFGPQQQYPFAPNRGYVPPEASSDGYVRMLRTIGCERAVIVQPSVYGTDNRCTADAARSGKFAFRGVAVIDHFGHIDAADGLQAPGFQALLRLAQHERCWFKLIGPYRLSKQPPLFPDVTPFARALVAAAPDRCVWGTDWPHPNATFMPNDGDLADMLLDWIPDEALRKRVLVDNPARLYDFK